MTQRSTMIGVIVALSLGCARGVAAQDDGPDRPSLRVFGTGEVAAAPDTAQIHTGVVTEAVTAKEAVDANSRAMQEVIAALRELGVDPKDVQTERFDVTPQYRHEPNRKEPPRIVGYRASNGVRVIVRELEGVGRILDGVVQAGANEMRGISFSVAEPQPLLDEARKRAVADARRKAGLFAEAAEVELGRVLSLEEQGTSAPIPLARVARAEAMAAVPVEPGQLELSANVVLVFAIE